MVNKITSPITPLEEVAKINEIIDGKQDTITSSNKLSASLVSGLATVATSGSYNDLSNQPTIPTVNNATLTITQGGTTKGTFTANASSDVTIDLDAGGGGGSSRNIGEIIASTLPLTEAGLHLLDGSLISGSGSYSAFVNYMAGLVSDYPDCFCSESDWQTSVTNYGVCGKFVYDSVNNTVRLPKRTSEHGDLIKSYKSGSDWYRIYSDGWCEQGGEVSIADGGGFRTITYQIPFTANPNVLITIKGSAYNAAAYLQHTNNAKESYPTYFTTYVDNNIPYKNWQACGYVDITDLQQNPVYEYIVIATSVKTDIEVDIDEIATDLNGKADTDFTNITNTAKASIAHNAMPSGTVITGIFTSPITATPQTYTAPADGYVMVGASVGAGNALEITVDDKSRFYQYVSAGHSFGNYTPVRKGQTVKVFISYGGGSATLENSYFEYAVGSI